jgi:hypothetical protein
MSIVVTVRIPDADIERVREVEKTHAHLNAKIKDALKRHGCIAHRRLYRANEILDIDEWETEEGVKTFLEEMMPVIRELAAARGTGRPVDSVWQIY